MSQAKHVQSNWKDIDEGIYLAKQCYFLIWKPLLLLLISLAFLLLFVFDELSVYWIVIIIWWLKPFYDRLILQILRQYVSRSEQTFRPQLYSIFRLWFSLETLKGLTFRRFSFVRSFLLPVYQLEQNKSYKLKERIRVISSGSSSRAANLTFLGLLTENVITITFISMLFFVIPAELRSLLLNNELLQDQMFIKYITVLMYVLTLMITEPLYVASGFSLYMNKRKRLEAWDVELIFKDLVKRRAYA